MPNQNTQEEWRNDLRMEIIHILEEVSGDIWCDCEPVNEVINEVFDRLIASHTTKLVEVMGKLPQVTFDPANDPNAPTGYYLEYKKVLSLITKQLPPSFGKVKANNNEPLTE